MLVLGKKLGLVICVIILSSCASFPSMTDSCTVGLMKVKGTCVEPPIVVHLPTHQELLDLPAPEDRKSVV